MSNKRKPKLLDFGAIAEKKPSKSFDFRLKTDKTPENPSNFQENRENPSETLENREETAEKSSKDEPILLKPSLKPAIASKKSGFSFDSPNAKKISVNPVPKINIICAEDEKTEESQGKVESLTKPKAKSLRNPVKTAASSTKKAAIPSLSIDTEQINENYSYGGEKGKRIAIGLEELSEEYREIAELAAICVKYMSKSPKITIKCYKIP